MRLAPCALGYSDGGLRRGVVGGETMDVDVAVTVTMAVDVGYVDAFSSCALMLSGTNVLQTGLVSDFHESSSRASRKYFVRSR